jgi:hypothetical protein
MTRSKSNALNVRASVADRTESAVFSAICSNAKDPESCRAYVERLQQASLNIERSEPPSK